MNSGKDRPQGGDVEGLTKTDSTWSNPLAVRSASFDPGYDLDNTLRDNGTKADLVRGYCTYGKAVGK